MFFISLATIFFDKHERSLAEIISSTRSFIKSKTSKPESMVSEFESKALESQIGIDVSELNKLLPMLHDAIKNEKRKPK